MDLANANVDLMMAGPLLIIMVCLGGLLWIAMLGGSLKYSIEIFVDDGPRYWVCALASIILITINVAVVVGIHFAVGPQPWYIISGYQMIMQMVLVMLLARCDPIKAFLAAFTHGFISSVGTVILAFVFIFGYFSAVGGALERNKNVARQPDRPVEVVTNPFVK